MAVTPGYRGASAVILSQTVWCVLLGHTHQHQEENRHGVVSPRAFVVLAVVVSLFAGLWSAAASAQAYPLKPIRLIVPFPSGGVIDIVGRVVAQRLSQGLGQSVFVDNRAGAAGTVGVEAGAKSPGDGYTLVLGTTGTLASAPSLYPSLGYDPIKSFAPVSLLVSAPFLVVVHPSVPANSLKGLIDFSKSRPGQLNFGSVGSGSPPHIAGEMFRSAARVDLVHVPYKGLPTGVTDLITGRIQIMFNQLAPFLPSIHAGKLRPLAVAASNRIPQLPSVPTAAESGLPGYEVSIWMGLLAPSGTPHNVITRLNAEVVKALATKEVQDSLTAQGFEPNGSTPEQFSTLIVSESAKWSRAIKASGVKLD
jgi:tripartite-type tricarboxylate transporter receptor subunit TctC